MTTLEATKSSRKPTLRAPRFCVFGGATDCYNLGVAALGTGSVAGLRLAFPDAHIAVQTFDTDPIARVQLPSGALELPSIQAWSSDSLRNRGSVAHLRMAGRIARRIGTWSAAGNRALKTLMESDVIFDISGGDSFADIYGPISFDYQASLKQMARDLGKPLVLLPQTFGPYTRPESIAAAGDILQYATLAATREVHGIEELQSLYGRVPGNVVNSPDVAFLMDPMPVARDREPFLFAGGSADEPLIGLNVSGLLYFEDKRFGLASPYAGLMEAIAHWAIESRRGRLLLVPHVLSDRPIDGDLSRFDPAVEASDTLACKLLERRLLEKFPGRVGSLSWPYGPAETKFCIGQCDFFIGARMHACIGSISQAIPTVTLAYSKKALGVMSHLNMGDSVVDLRTLDAAASLGAIDALFDRRADLRAALSGQVPAVRRRVEEFFTRVLPASLEKIGIAVNPAG